MTHWVWVLFCGFVLVMLALDLFVVNRTPHVVKTKEALLWTGVCVVLALAFSVLVYFGYRGDWLQVATDYAEHHPKGATAHELGLEAATKFVTGWLVEYSLSLDNIFVIAVIFRHFRVESRYQHRVLFWGILGALVLRAVMILTGAALVSRFEWVLYLFGAILVYTGIRLVTQKEEDMDPEHGWVYRSARKLLPLAHGYHGERFVVVQNGRRLFTGLFLVLVVVETTDVVFAVDSIPAILGITTDPFIVFTSNVFAILGLRSMYFALAAMMDKFKYLKYSLAFVLVFVGVKMLVKYFGVHFEPAVTLSIITGALGLGVGVSLWASRGSGAGSEQPGEAPPP